jgi:hypothetical protein
MCVYVHTYAYIHTHTHTFVWAFKSAPCCSYFGTDIGFFMYTATVTDGAEPRMLLQGYG